MFPFEHLLAGLVLLLSFSRSAFLIYLLYSLISFIRVKILPHRPRLIVFISRILPLLAISLIFVLFFFYRPTDVGAYRVDLSDSSFQSRIQLLLYLPIYLQNFTFSEIPLYLFGHGWSIYQDLRLLMPDTYTGTYGHTLIGIIPEVGIFVFLSIFSILYRFAYKGFLEDSLILCLCLLAFLLYLYNSYYMSNYLTQLFIYLS